MWCICKVVVLTSNLNLFFFFDVVVAIASSDRNHSFVSNKYVSQVLWLPTVTANKNELWTSVRPTSFPRKSHHYNPFQSSSSSSTSFCIWCIIYTFFSCSEQIFLCSLSLVVVSTVWDHYKFLRNCPPNPPLSQQFTISEK